MGFAVYHLEKGKSNGSSLGGHIDRIESQKHTFKNADVTLRGENITYDTGEYSKQNLGEAIKNRIKNGYNGKKELRKDAVKYLSIVLSGTHEDMKRIFANPDLRQQWINSNYAFISQEFRKENLVRFTLHMDEKTPHIHAVIVPITADGRLSAKELIGNKIAMSQRQTRYADQMKPFGLERGVVGSKAVHNSEGWYLGQQKEKQKAELSHLPEFTLLDRLNPSNYIKSVTESLKNVSKSAVDAKLEADRRGKQLQQVKSENTLVLQKFSKLQADLRLASFKAQLAFAKINQFKLTDTAESQFQDLNKQFLEKVEAQKPRIVPDHQEEKKNRGFRR